MEQQEKPLSEKESLELITTMIHTAKESYYDTGASAIMWGAVIAFCSLERLAELQFGYRLPFDIYLLTIAAVIPSIYFAIKEKRERKVKTYDDVYMDYIWLGFGIGIALMIFIVNSLGAVIRDSNAAFLSSTGQAPAFTLLEFIAPLFLLLYGLPTFITGAACKFKPMLWGGLFCWACCIVTIYTNIKIDLLLTAASAIMAWLIPGVLMQKEYRMYKKQQAVQHV